LARIKKVNIDVNKILSTGGTREKLTSQGFDVLGGTPEEFAATIVSDTKAFSAVLAKTRATAR
jgi:tripartite-type tricarboxylate transporter receptor subunit TctC